MTIPILAAVPFLLPLIACAVSLEKPGRVLRKHIYKESFENSELNAWASYPPNQDTAYDPYLYPGHMNPGEKETCLIAECRPPWDEAQALGAIKRLDLAIGPDFSLAFRYYIKSIHGDTALKVLLPLRTGERLAYRLPRPLQNSWGRVLISWADLLAQNPGLGKTPTPWITAAVVLVEIPRADKTMPAYLGLDDIEIAGLKTEDFRFLEPQVAELSEWRERIPLHHYRPGDALSIRGTLAFTAERVDFEAAPFAAPDEILLKGRLSALPDGAWRSEDVRLEGRTFPPGLYRGRILAGIGGETVSETFFTFFVAPENPEGAHPRVLFERAAAGEFRERFEGPRFRPLLDKYLERARTSRSAIRPGEIVFDIDQFPREDWIASLPAWYTARIMAWREALSANTIAFLSGKDPDAGTFCRELLLRLADWPQWNHPWMEARGFHTYYPLGEFADAFAVAYDAVHSLCTEEERRAVREGLLRNFVIPAFRTYVEADQVTSESSNWISHIAGGALVALMAIYGDDASRGDLEPWLTGFILKEHKYIQTVFGKDGSYGEGFRYYNFAMQSLARTLPALGRLFGLDLAGPIDGSYLETLWSGIIRRNLAFSYGDTESYLKKEAQAWWIGTENGPMNNWAWLLHRTKDPFLAWLYSALKEFDTLQEVLFPVEGVPAREPDSLGQVRFFRDVGTAVFRSGWGEDDFVFSFRCGPFYNHQHMDQGTFFLADHGRVFLEERYDGEHHYYDDPLYRTHAVQTISHNTILLDRNPMSQRPGDPAGFAPGLSDHARFRRWLDAESFAFSSGTLDGLYGEKVRAIRRSVLYLKPRTIILVDEVTPGPADVEVDELFHTRRKADIVLGEGRARIALEKSALEIIHVLPGTPRRDIETDPHFLCQFAEAPLVERGHLRISGKTGGVKLVLANILAASPDGQASLIRVRREGTTGIADMPSLERPAEAAVNGGDGLRWKDYDSDALILAEAGPAEIFAAEATRLDRAGKRILASENPIVADIFRQGDRIVFTCHLEKASRVALRTGGKPLAITAGGRFLPVPAYDARAATITLDLPAGESLLELKLEKAACAEYEGKTRKDQ